MAIQEVLQAIPQTIRPLRESGGFVGALADRFANRCGLPKVHTERSTGIRPDFQADPNAANGQRKGGEELGLSA